MRQLSSRFVTSLLICFLTASMIASAQTSTYSSMAIAGTFNNHSAIPNMVLVSNNTWRGTAFVISHTNAFMFVANGAWAAHWWGETNQTSHTPPFTGIAEKNPAIARKILMTNSPLSSYEFTFNDSTYEYAVLISTSPPPPIVAVSGDFNGWNGIPNMELLGGNLWQGDFYISASSGRFKFNYNNWQIQVGDTNQVGYILPISGTAEIVGYGSDIVYSNAIPGYYRFTLDNSTLAYSMSLLYSETSGVNLIENSSFEVAGSTSERARHWQWSVPDGNGGYWSDSAWTRAQRQTWRSRSGAAEGALCAKWSPGDEDFGGWWQQGPAQPGLMYQGSAWFWADPGWVAQGQELKIEFLDADLNILSQVQTAYTATNTHWTRHKMQALAPAGTVWGRIVIAMNGAGTEGAMQFDDVELRQIAGRSQDFATWGSLTDDGCHALDWELCQGRIVSNTPPAAPEAGIFISEYVEGSSNNKAIEIYNGTTNNIDLTADGYYLQLHFNGNLTTSSIALSGTLAAQSTHVITHTSAGSELLAYANQASGSLSFNGDDAITLRSGGVSGPILDRFGRMGEDPGTSWGGVTHDKTLRRKASVTEGDPNRTDPFDPTIEWDIYPIDTFDGLGFHIIGGGGAGGYLPPDFSASFAPGPGNYLASSEIVGGIGTVSFWYRAENAAPAMDFAIETSINGTTWTNAGSLNGITTTNWQYFSLYIYRPQHAYVRIINTSGVNRLRIDDVYVAEPTSVRRQEDFRFWTDPLYGTDGIYELNGWVVANGRVVTNHARANYCAWINNTNGFIRSPFLLNGAGAVSFWHRAQAAGLPSDIAVQYSTDGIDWTTVQEVTSAAATYSYASVFLFTTNPVYVRLAANLSTTDGVPAYVLIDDISIANPAVFRVQNFDRWPTQSSYGNSSFEGWSVWQSIVNSEQAYAGQAARLVNTVSAGSYVLTPRFDDGIGTIRFQYRRWSISDTAPQYQLQFSPDGINWIIKETIIMTNATDYTRYERYFYDTTNHYVRWFHSAGAGRALIDEIEVDAPTPPASVNLTGWIDPEAPFSNDWVRIHASAGPIYGARNVAITSYYRIGTSGAFSALSMALTNFVFYSSTTRIPPQPSGTIVQYYIQATFTGPGADSSSPVFYPAGGSNSPAWYGIPRARAGQAWINEICYVSDLWLGLFQDTNEFVEICGPAGLDISGWTLELHYGEHFNLTNLYYDSYAHYRFPPGTILTDVTNGYGFFVVGDIGLGALADMNFTNFTKYPGAATYDDNVADGHPDGMRLLNEVGSVEYAFSYNGFMPGFNRVPMSQDPFESWSLTLVGSGSNYADFAWTLTNYTPRTINPGQTLVPQGDPPEPPVPPDSVEIVRFVYGTNLTIFTAGNTNASPWTVAPYWSLDLRTEPQDWQPLTPFNSAYEGGGSNRIWFNLPTATTNRIFRIMFSAP